MPILPLVLLVASAPLSAGRPPPPVIVVPPMPGPGEPIRPALSAGRSLIPALQLFAFLSESCWRATYADGAIDTHCFTPMLGGRFFRDRHRVSRGNYAGETVYSWDVLSGEIRWHYYSSQGWVLVGTAAPTTQGLNFAYDAASQAGHAPRPTRVAWRFDGPDAYVVTTEVRENGTWRAQGETLRFQRIGPAPAD